MNFPFSCLNILSNLWISDCIILKDILKVDHLIINIFSKLLTSWWEFIKKHKKGVLWQKGKVLLFWRRRGGDLGLYMKFSCRDSNPFFIGCKINSFITCVSAERTLRGASSLIEWWMVKANSVFDLHFSPDRRNDPIRMRANCRRQTGDHASCRRFW